LDDGVSSAGEGGEEASGREGPTPGLDIVNGVGYQDLVNTWERMSILACMNRTNIQRSVYLNPEQVVRDLSCDVDILRRAEY
jgi:hypothetical protein